jgi:hypothetical protein
MVRRTIKIQRKPQKGGAGPLGEDINSISTFVPNSIPNLALWIKINKESIKYSKISEYIPTQPITVQQQLRTTFKNNLDQSVISEIIGAGNSLVRFELDSVDSKSFPTFIADPSGTDIISLSSNTTDGSVPKPFKLVTKNRIELANNYSMWSTSENIVFDYIPSFNQLVISPQTYLNDNTPTFSEIIVYSRQLNATEKQQVEGYLAYVNNNQYKLPLHHSYLPDMSYLASLTPIISNIQLINDSINEMTHDIDNIPTDLCGNKLALKGRITDAIDDMTDIKQMFSKGALLSKKNGSTTLDSIYKSADTLHVLTVPFTPEYIEHKFTEFRNLIVDIKHYTEINTPDITALATEQEKLEQEHAFAAAQTEELLEETEREIQAHEFYEKLRQRSDLIKQNGDMMYGPIYKDFEDRVSIYWDAIEYNHKKIESAWGTLIYSFKTIETQINSRDWLKYVSTIDISENEVVKRGNSVYSIEYRDPYLNIIQSQYQKIRNQVYDGDIAYIHSIAPVLYRECSAIMKDIKNKIIQPITIKTFLPHFKQRYNEILKYTETFTAILEPITASIKIITTALEDSKRSRTASIINDLPVIPTQENLRQECQVVYMRRTNSSDFNITGIEYIVTDVEGNLHNTINVDGEIDNSYIFPKYMNLKSSEEDKMFLIYHPYKDLLGNELRQEYKILDELPNLSIIDSISKPRRPNYWFHKGDNLFEIARDQINGIHQFIVEYIQYPIQLPKYAIPDGSYFLIQNVGPLPIQVQIPGFPNDLIDMIGFGESMLYIYSGLNESYGNTYYGRVPWREDYLPYDTLLNSPRSSYSAFVTELNTSIYVKKNLEPILDYDGYFIKAVVDSKGFTYDIDDVYLANPYMVRSVKQVRLSDLKHKGSKMNVKTGEPQIWVIKDIVTNLPVLCNFKGLPGINEYGFCKFARTPIMIIDNRTVIRGAFGDINVKIAGTIEIEQMGVLEPFLNFNTVYRSKFVQPYTHDNKKTFVFIGRSKYPIISPKNNMIEAQGWSLVPPHELKYVNANNTIGTAYLSKDLSEIHDSSFNAVPYPYISVQDSRLQIEMKKSAKIILNRYTANKNYIIECQHTIKTTYDRIQKLGEGASEGTLSILTTANKQIQADLDKYTAEQKSIEPIQASLDSQMLTPTLKIAIDMLDLKMKEIVVSVMNTFKSISDSIEFMMGLVNEVEGIETTVANFRLKDTVEIEQLIVSVKSTFQADAQNLKITGAPEFDRLLKLMIKYKVEFIQRLGKLEEALKSRPGYSTEYPKWITDKRSQIKELNNYILKIREIEQTDIPRIFEVRETIKRTESVKRFRELATQSDFYKKYKKTINLWLGLPENNDYISQEPIINTGDPAIKGLSIDLIVFNELKNPSVQRDWQEIDTTAEISARISAELITPVNILKDKYRLLFVGSQNNDDLSTVSILKQMDLNGIRSVLDNLTLKVDKTTKELLTFESELAPILKAYENIRSDLRSSLRKTLLEMKQKLQEEWLKITAKRTALETLLIQNPDPKNERIIEEINNIEQRVLDITKNNSTYYDNITYFKMRSELIEQKNIQKTLETLMPT